MSDTSRQIDAEMHKALGYSDDCAGPMILTDPDGDGGFLPACTVCDYAGWDEPTHKAVVPAYSESISAAWQIITRLTGTYVFSLEVNGGSTWAGFSPIDQQATYDAYTDGTDDRAAAEAITRAALAAVRAKGDSDAHGNIRR